MPQTVGQEVTTQIDGGLPGVTYYDTVVQKLANGGFVILNKNNQYAEQNYYLHVYDAHNEPVTTRIALSSSYDLSSNSLPTPEIVATASGFAVAYSTASNLAGMLGDAYLQIFDSAGNPLGSPVLMNLGPDKQGQPNPTGDRDPDLAFTSDNHLVGVWTESVNNQDPNIALQVFDAAGTKLGSQIVLNAETAGTQSLPKASALDDGNVVVAWTDAAAGGLLRGQIVSSSGVRVGGEFTIAASGIEVVEMLTRANGFTAYWRASDGLHEQSFSNSGAATGLDTLLAGIVPSDTPSITPYSSGGAVISWNTAGGASFTQVFDPAGQAVTDAFQAHTVPGGVAEGDLSAIDLGAGTLLTVGTTGNTILRTTFTFGDTPKDLTGTAGQDFIGGDARDNVLNGGAGPDQLYGFDGNDLLLGSAGADRLDGGAGVDTADYSDYGFGLTINLRTGTASDGDTLVSIENIIGGAAGDTITGDDGANRLAGGPGDDVIVTGKGGDVIDGGAGTDTVSYIDSNGTVLVNLTLQLGFDNYADSDTYISVENVVGSNFDDILIGDEGTNRLSGGQGNDLLVGARGADILDGGTGTDTVEYSDSNGTVFVNLTLGQGFNNSAEGDTYIGIENVTGSNFSDYLIGSNAANQLDGAGGDDVLIGSLGGDTLIGGAGIDFASYEDNQGAVFVNLASGHGFGNAAQGDTYQGIENVRGSIYSDYLIGDGGVNRLEGGDGDDTLIGGLGADVLVGGNGLDWVSYEDNWGAVFVNLMTGHGNGNAAEGDTYQGIENVRGGVYYDTLIGDDNANVLDGGRGADTLIGNGGADNFLFDSALDGASNVDHIVDFTQGSDRFELDHSIFGLPAGALGANVFIAGSAATGGSNRIVYDQSTGTLYYDDDGFGSDPAVAFAVLDNKPALTSADFVVI